MSSVHTGNKFSTMKSLSGSIIVLSGAIIMGLCSQKIPNEAIQTLSSMSLMITGLIIVFTDKKSRE